LALADTGVATPASQPALRPGGSVHGEMAAATQPAKRRGWMLLTAGAVAAAGLAVVAVLKQKPPAPAPVVVTAAPLAAPKIDPPPPKIDPPQVEAPPVVAEAPPPPETKKKTHHSPAHVAAPAPVAAPPPPETPKKTTSPFAEAESLFKNGNVDGALAKYLEAAKADPRDAVTQRQIGKCYNRLGQRDKAQPYLKRYLELRPDASDAAFIQAMIQ
jgi:hypothetical protein